MKLPSILSGSRPRLILGSIGIALIGFLAIVFSGNSKTIDDVGLTYTATIEPLTISVSESGTIESLDKVTVRSRVRGTQTIIYLIPEGTVVQEGDLLVELDSSSIEDDLVQKEIDLENIQAELVSARENLAVVRNQAEADVAEAKLNFAFAQQDLEKYRDGEYAMEIRQADSKITLARADLQQAEDRLTGSLELFEKKYISATELDADRLTLQRAEMDLELAQQQKALLENFTYQRQIAKLESDVDQTRLALDRAERKARANIAEAEARFSARRSRLQREENNIAELRERIANCRIVAPTAGMVVYAPQGNRWNSTVLEAGTEVRERQELIYLPTADAMSATISIHESVLNRVEVGQTATLTVDALPNRKFTGTVTSIAIMAQDGGWRNPDLKQYSTTITIDQVEPSLRSGMTCKAEILVAHYDQALTVPVQSVLRVDGQPTVFVADQDGVPQPAPVSTGLDNNRKILITGGLAEGTNVLLAPPLMAAERLPNLPAETPEEVNRVGDNASGLRL